MAIPFESRKSGEVNCQGPPQACLLAPIVFLTPDQHSPEKPTFEKKAPEQDHSNASSTPWMVFSTYGSDCITLLIASSWLFAFGLAGFLTFTFILFYLQWLRKLTNPPPPSDPSLSSVPIPPFASWKDYIPFVGDTVSFALDQAKFCARAKGLTKFYLVGTGPTVIVDDARLVEKIHRGEGRLIEASKIQIPGLAKVFGPEALSVLEGKEHKFLRNIMLPCFQRSTLETVRPAVQKIISRHLEQWSEDGVFDAGEGASKMSFDVGTAFVGFDFSSLSAAEKDEIRAECILIAQSTVALPIDLPWTTYRKAINAGNSLRARFDQLIAERRAGKCGSLLKDDLIQRMVNARDSNGNRLTDAQIKDNLVGLIFAAFDTTASALLMFFTQMCSNPDVAEEAHHYLSTSLEELDSPDLTLEQLRHLTYIDQLNAEVMRHTPIAVGSSFRRAKCDFQLGDVRIPKGWTVIVDEISRSKDPAYWKDPEKFQPRRYETERSSTTPFGGGSKTCLGQAFAQMERKLVATLVLRDYHMEYAQGRDWRPRFKKYDPILRTDGECLIKIRRRSSNVSSTLI